MLYEHEVRTTKVFRPSDTGVFEYVIDCTKNFGFATWHVTLQKIGI